MGEIAIFEWSAVLAKSNGVEVGLRGLPFGAFMFGMIVGRLSVTRLSRRFDLHLIAVAGAFLSAITMALRVIGATVFASHSPGLAVLWLAGWWL